MIYNFILLIENRSPIQGLKTAFAYFFTKNKLLRWSKNGSDRIRMFL
jgi:hypothetical protein